MKILHVIPSVAPGQGGPSFALPLMARGLARAGVSVDVATTDDDGLGGHLDVPLGEGIAQGGARFFYFRRQTKFYKASWPLTVWLARNIGRYDCVHIHALFSYASCAAAHLAISNRVPYVVRPLGVLNRWGMANRRRLLKQLSLRLVERRVLGRAAFIHYTSEQERLEAEEAGVMARAAVIPLGVDTTEFQRLPGPERFYEKFPQAAGRDVVLFLSRLDGKKGLDLLLPVFAALRRSEPNALLVVAGAGDEAFTGGLSGLAARLGAADHIIWAGFLSGQEKLSALAAASVFALPSRSENFGIAVVEAMAAGLPCVLSDQIGIAPDVDRLEAGLVVPCEADALASALGRLLADSQLRARLGAAARRVVAERFSLEAMTRSLVGLYGRVARDAGRSELPIAPREPEVLKTHTHGNS
jgi:glycosyltransferase involved in cell wall biosynthesis